MKFTMAAPNRRVTQRVPLFPGRASWCADSGVRAPNTSAVAADLFGGDQHRSAGLVAHGLVVGVPVVVVAAG